MTQKTIVISEIGENHMGNFDLAYRMIEESAAAGADMVKFQSYCGADVCDTDPEKEWFSQVQVSDEMHFRLKHHAEQCGVEFLSSPFSVGRARFLCEKLGMKKIKIASSQMLCQPMLDYVNEHADTVFLSTGMATLEEIREATQHLERVKSLCLLQCTTQYPTRAADANLAVIATLSQEFPRCRIGYSDHTCGILAPIVAVALGAEVIEKHFTLDKTLPGTDHVLSAEPAELKEMIRQIREVELLLGSAIKQPTSQEQEIVSRVRSRFAGVPAWPNGNL